MDKREFVIKYQKVIGVGLRIYNRLHIKNRFIIGKNLLTYHCAQLKNVRIHIYGEENQIIIHNFARLFNTSITVNGNGNTVEIGEFCAFNQTELHIEDDGNTIRVGDYTTIHGKTHLAAIEGTKIEIGNDCMFSSDIHFATGDSHSILDFEGKRRNLSQDIVIGNHVWLGTKVTCLKNVRVADNCIVGACTLLCKQYDTLNCIIGGGCLVEYWKKR